MARGFTQVYGIDYAETYAPVARYSSIRLIIALAAHYNWELHQMDVKTAYLNGELDVPIYMQAPDGTRADQSGVPASSRLSAHQESVWTEAVRSTLALQQQPLSDHTRLHSAARRSVCIRTTEG